MLHYIASLDGGITYDPDSGEVSINKHVIKYSNMSEIFRILFTHRPGDFAKRHSIGMKEFLSALRASAMPPNIIADKYWSNYFASCCRHEL